MISVFVFYSYILKSVYLQEIFRLIFSFLGNLLLTACKTLIWLAFSKSYNSNPTKEQVFIRLALFSLHYLAFGAEE